MAVASRESRAGSALGRYCQRYCPFYLFFRFCLIDMVYRDDNKPGYGDHNHAFGLMQVAI